MVIRLDEVVLVSVDSIIKVIDFGKQQKCSLSICRRPEYDCQLIITYNEVEKVL